MKKSLILCFIGMLLLFLVISKCSYAKPVSVVYHYQLVPCNIVNTHNDPILCMECLKAKNINPIQNNHLCVVQKLTFSTIIKDIINDIL